MVIMIWMQTGFAMVVLSAAIKAIPDEIIEAARIDGASELQVFRRDHRAEHPARPIVVVTTYMVINALKVFDIVFVMGNAEANGTEVDRRADDPVVLHPQPRRPRRGDRGGAVPRRRPGDGLERPPVPRAGGDPVTLTAPVPTEVADGASPTRQGRDRRRRRGGWFVRITIIVVVLIWLIPTVGVLSRRSGPRRSSTRTGWWTALAHPFRAGEWTLENYRTALDAGGFKNAFLNSLAVTIPSTVIPITIAAFAAYAFSWMEFRGRYVMFVLVVGLMVVPLQMALIPILRLYTGGASIGGVQVFPDLDLNGTFLGIWLAHTAFGLPLATYLLRNYIGSLPSSIIESAKIDGADHFTIFWRLVVPLSVPALAAFAIFQFLWVWNDLLVAYVFLGGTPRHRVDHDRARQPGRAPAARTGTCSPRPRSSPWPCRSPCSSRSSATSSAASRPAR